MVIYLLHLFKTTIVPIVQNKAGDLSDSNNYRPIAIATITSKLLESVLLLKCSDYLTTCDNQFRFNPRAPSATYMLQGIHMHIATQILNKILQYVCVGILHIRLDIQKKIYYSTLYHCPT